ncbi:uncharacterized protein LOC120359458 isoform X1 [Solenopsis invicta]|uniref:uncharacterized protein LOC120359458 isoform X1 n=1 Tax=Solenopsis invicta TaxID=13686 RepID=UPI00193DB4B4|nr:uncharacterized protein LOC120359458 isoform X1 [Solenopsis invicta]
MNYEVQCNITDCFYKFACVCSLMKHIKNEHSVQKWSCEITEISNNANKDVVHLIKETNTIEQHKTILTEPLKDLSETLYNNEEFSIDYFKSKVFNFALCLVTQLYAYGSLNRKVIHKIIIDICTTYINNCLDFLKCKFQNTELHDMLDVMKNGFNIFRTEHLTLKFLSKINCFFPPKKVIIRSFLKYGKLKSKTCFVIRKRTLSIIPIKLVLKKFLEMPMVFSAIMKFVDKCNRSLVINSVIKGDFWKKIVASQTDKIIFPLVLYFDDIEINNPLRTHRTVNKIGAVYCSIPILPIEYVSKLENIFLYQLHNSQDHNVLGNKNIFHLIIKQIIDLQNNGIIINIDGEEKKIFFVLTYIVGDNLGLNTILGFSKSFNSSYCCRVCTLSKDEMVKQKKEKPEKLRTRENYFTHCSEKTFGIKENCVFHVISNYHVTQNFSVDPMHDLFEGICRYDLAKILNNFINKENFFTLDVLNERINCFNHTADSNVPPPIQSDSIKKELIILSASEMHYLIKNLGLFVGDLIKSNNKYWQLYLIMRKIVCIAIADAINEEIIEIFEKLVF